MKISGKAKKNITTPKGGGFLSYIKNAKPTLVFLSIIFQSSSLSFYI
jgi:hypothetical protein